MEIVVPEMGESIVEATIARWLKAEGDPVSVGEPVVELETDKVDLEVGAKQDGVLSKILHKEGDDVRVGEVLGIIETGESAGAQPEQKTSPPKPEPAETSEPENEKESAATGKPVEEKEPAGTRAAERATPVARRLAEAQGVDLDQIAPARPGDRVTKEDVQRFLETRPQVEPGETRPPADTRPQVEPGRTAEPVRPRPEPPTATDGARRPGERPEERIRMSRRRRTIASRLVEAQQTAAMLTTFNDVDMTAVIELRKRRQDAFREKHGIKLGFMSFFVKAVIGALKAFPRLNAEIQGDDIVLKYYYDIGIAVGAEEGLVVPVLRDAQNMSFAQIEKQIRDFAQKAQDGTLTLEDLRGGTFTITNGGVFGSLLSTPILNPPQVGILGLHRIEERPVALNGQVSIRPMMYLALSYDHRIVDGREAVQFLVRIKELIEDPETLLLEG